MRKSGVKPDCFGILSGDKDVDEKPKNINAAPLDVLNRVKINDRLVGNRPEVQ